MVSRCVYSRFVKDLDDSCNKLSRWELAHPQHMFHNDVIRVYDYLCSIFQDGYDDSVDYMGRPESSEEYYMERSDWYFEDVSRNCRAFLDKLKKVCPSSLYREFGEMVNPVIKRSDNIVKARIRGMCN